MNREKELYAHLKVGDAEAEFRGGYAEVWRSINRFLTKAGSLASPVKAKTSDYVPREGSLGEKVMLLCSGNRGGLMRLRLLRRLISG